MLSVRHLLLNRQVHGLDSYVTPNDADDRYMK